MSHPATPSRFIGCDVGKTAIVVFDTASGRTYAVANTPEALSGFAASLEATCFVVCEATGGYERDLLAALIAAGVPACRADARKSLPSGLTRGLRPSAARLERWANPTPSTQPRWPDTGWTATPNFRFGAPASPSESACKRSS